jgi:hypothetical protein
MVVDEAADEDVGVATLVADGVSVRFAGFSDEPPRLAQPARPLVRAAPASRRY